MCKKRIVSLILSIVLIVTLIPISNNTKVYAGTMEQFINDARWRNGTYWGYNTRPKIANYSAQGCCAYVCDFTKYVYGKNSYREGQVYHNINEVRAGDVIDVGVHWFVVLGRNGNSLYTAEGNAQNSVWVRNGRYTISGNKFSYRSDSGNSYYSLYAGYHFTGGSSSTPAQVLKPSIQVNGCDVSDHNITPKAKVYNPNRSKISQCGVQIKDGSTIIGSKEEQFDTRNNTVASGDIWYNCQNELSVSLRAGHTYLWNIYAYVGGTRVETGWQTVKTTGTEKPNKPTFVTSKRHYAVGDSASISWSPDVNATKGYSLTITQTKGGTYTQTLTTDNYNATSLAFVLPNEGEYEVKGFARGSSDSEYSTLSGVITAHNPSNVKFIETLDDESENILWQGKVKYGYSANAPSGVSRKGHTFWGWDKEYNNITEDVVIKAIFKRNKYNVNFYDKDNNIINTQSVLYGDDAVAPTPPEAEAGYVFAGWNNEDYKNVQGNVNVKACYVWKNDNLPMVVSIKKCEFKEDGYVVTYDIKNNPNNKTKGRALFSLRTSTGKLLDTTESKAFSFAKGEEKTNLEMYIPYEGPASFIDIYIIDGFSKGIPISETASLEVTRDWSNWTAEKPDSNVEVETKKEYRYKDLLSTTTRTSINDGWTLVKSEIDNDWNYGNWSDWTRNSYSALESTTSKREVQSKDVSDNNGSSYNVYYFWKDPNKLAFSYYDEGGFKYYEFYDTQHLQKWYGSYQGTDMYRINDNNGGKGAYFDWEVWWYLRTVNIPSTTHKEYRYRDGTKGYTYYWNKWDEWSDWNDTYVSDSQTRKTESRDVYRYRAKMTDIEDNSGKKYTVSGKVDESFANKEALIQVYKGNEPSDSNNEYIGKVTINSDGSYSHSFVAREEISEKTGDYSVMMAIEGGNEPIYLNKIEAPKPEYTVTFKDINGGVIKKQKVLEGESAEAPVAPDEENYTFVGWDFGVTNVRDDMEITAQYVKNKYSVAFVNWDTREVQTNVFSYGDPIKYPDENDVEGYDFVGWTTTDGRTISTVTENIVLVANYKIKKFKANFYDINHNLLSSQEVEYGLNATAPEAPEVENMKFTGWNTYDFAQIKSDVDVYPNYEYIETTKNPTCDLESCTLSKQRDIHLSAEEGAEIYYTTDGSVPSKISNKYDGKITVDKNMYLQYIAVSPNKNASEVMNASYLLISSEDDDGALVIKKDTYNIERGSSAKITYFLSHSDSNMKVEFYSLNDNIVSVDDDGTLKANQVGKTQIFARTKDCKYADYCDVVVTTDEIDAQKITLNSVHIVGRPNTVEKLNAEVYPETTTDKKVDWYSDDTNVATVDENGLVELHNEGTTVVRAISQNGTCYAECEVENNGDVTTEKLYISDEVIELNKGESKTLSAFTYKGNVSCQWLSSDITVAMVDDNGVITAVNEGYTTVYAGDMNGNIASCTVIVKSSKSGTIPDGNVTASDKNNSNTNQQSIGVTSLKTQKITTDKIKTYKVKLLKKKKVVIHLNAKTTGNGKLKYKVYRCTPIKNKKYVSVARNGKVTIKKGAKKGKYKILIIANNTKEYEYASKVITIKVK